MSIRQSNIRPEHRRLAAELVAETRLRGGLAPVDLERFHADQDEAIADPFGKSIPQCPLGIWMGAECVFEELGIAEDLWRYEQDGQWRLSLNKAYNDKSEAIVGRRVLDETKADPSLAYPPVKELHDIFEAANVWHSGSWWLQRAAGNESELEGLLDRVERRLEDLRGFLLPEGWDRQKVRLMDLGVPPPLYRKQRGPVTFATSILGAENLIFLILDRPELAARLRDLILRAMLEMARVLDEEAGYTPGTAPRGFSFLDDNCCLLNPEMYELFGFPILQAIFQRYSPGPGDKRYQHSDSAMGHLLPVLARLELTAVNFGPALTVAEIREQMPGAVIHGQLAPFTLSRNEEEGMVGEFLRDFEMAREKRGLVFDTAGSVNGGSRLTGLRLIMAAIQRHGRYER
jgi:uroporphyrinogen decarboxylase